MTLEPLCLPDYTTQARVAIARIRANSLPVTPALSHVDVPTVIVNPDDWQACDAGRLEINRLNCRRLATSLDCFWPIRIWWSDMTDGTIGEHHFVRSSRIRTHLIALRAGDSGITMAETLAHELVHAAQLERLGVDRVHEDNCADQALDLAAESQVGRAHEFDLFRSRT